MNTTSLTHILINGHELNSLALSMHISKEPHESLEYCSNRLQDKEIGVGEGLSSRSDHCCQKLCLPVEHFYLHSCSTCTLSKLSAIYTICFCIFSAFIHVDLPISTGDEKINSFFNVACQWILASCHPKAMIEPLMENPHQRNPI